MKKLADCLIELNKDEVLKFWSCFTSDTLKKDMDPAFALKWPDVGYVPIANFNGVMLCASEEALTDAVLGCVRKIIER